MLLSWGAELDVGALLEYPSGIKARCKAFLWAVDPGVTPLFSSFPQDTGNFHEIVAELILVE